MGTRISGLISGFDTESIIKQMTTAYTVRRDKVWKQQKTLEYKQDAWKDMNKEINSFFTNTLSNTRLETSFVQDDVKIADEQIASVSGSSFSGIQNLTVKQVATNTYLTGAKVKQSYPIGINDDITVKYAGMEKHISITSDMSMSDVAKKLSEVGLKANFDERNGRLFLASRKTGLKSNFSIEGNDEILEALGLDEGAAKQVGQDAIIELNGAEFQSEENTFQINDLNINIFKAGSTTINKQSNNKIFDVVKDFIEKYNNVIRKIDTAYNAKKSNYEPLTDDERYAISDKQADEWEKLIKDSILSKDSLLGDISRLFKNDMMQSYSINGEKYSLARIGITTGNYFTTSQNERGVYNIDEKQLKQAIADDPNGVIGFITQLSSKMYNDLNDRMRSTSYNSAYTIFHDKEMKSNYDDFTKKIEKWDKKITEMEDKYYEKFTRMETALSKMQNQTNSLASLFGMTV